MSRQEFSKATKTAALVRANYKCQCGCELPIGVGDAVEFDHFPIPASMGGPNTLDNCRVLIKKHHAQRTFGDGIDSNSQIAKTTRLAEKRLGLRTKRSTFRGSKKFSGEVTFK